MVNKFQISSFKNDIFSDILYKFFGLNLQYKDYHFGTFCDELVHSFTKTVIPTATYCSIHHLDINISNSNVIEVLKFRVYFACWDFFLIGTINIHRITLIILFSF